ncbi:molybdopterin-guanine dinucleotide biosynthesis protein B [Desulfoprunum benzoelyticum]|uniref:Molybdopterin-guanine dinucleotide biosynthesis protein B n=1 Tax=Desulfoprunum benzoelyticum TaxID=1506996 RepID=A0A840UMY1_9BACT|nr:molybdopterin-guanine dinucleotide biosynthesis protein B [Desulfoprunum benzoelyticum]MBB5347132.1 molybdopterin-guanine dinucleotide biosynthesis protein B [Desulfoprunum benzoelyticum]MBM9531235.1 molybdopterin-guanine dinucleotide biosynthesis protein B [Desulfoprunum benzoelyticum]
MTPIVTFIGWHDSGKTTLASQVVSHLKARGYRVAVIKSSKEADVPFDTPGTDTAKHRMAGADSVMFVGPDKMVLQTANENLPLVVLAYKYCADVDIVIGEGFKDAPKVAKIEVLRDRARMLRKKVGGVLAVATDLDDVEGGNIFRLDQSLELAQFIEKRFLLGQRNGQDRAVLFVNGRRIALKNFVQDVLASTVHGFVGSLKCVDQIEEIEEIELRIRLPKT